MTEKDKVRRYLIVADHALDDQRLAAKVQQSLAAGPCQFYLLMLAVPPGSGQRSWTLIAASGGLAPKTGGNEEQGWQWASHQLAHELARLRKLGADADGETGEPHPLRAIREVLAKHPADEIILATAPHRMTRLLAMDLQRRVQRSSGLPVTVLGAARTES
jgi:GABA permease